LIVKATPNFFKKRDRLVAKKLITLEQYQKTIDIFKEDPKNKEIRPHKISCKKAYTIISITVLPQTQVRILISVKECEDETIYIASWIGKHGEYERIIKDKKNCKSLFVGCDDLELLSD